MIAIPAPFHQIAEARGPANVALLVVQFPAPAVSALCPEARLPVPGGIDARRIAIGLGRGRDARAAHVAACWRYRNYETFDHLLALVEFRGHFLVWHSPYGVGCEKRAEIKRAAQDALRVALMGESEPVILRLLDPDPVAANRCTDDEDYYDDDVERIADTKMAAGVASLRESLWALHDVHHLGRPTSLLSVGPWPNNGWHFPDRG
jgi:hypothetical protein